MVCGKKDCPSPDLFAAFKSSIPLQDQCSFFKARGMNLLASTRFERMAGHRLGRRERILQEIPRQMLPFFPKFVLFLGEDVGQ
jgi:hypothetical protein